MSRRRAALETVALGQQRRGQAGVKLGYGQVMEYADTTNFVSGLLPIGTSDFSIEIYCSFYGGGNSGSNGTVKNYDSGIYEIGFLSVVTENLGTNGVQAITFEGDYSNDALVLYYKEPDLTKRTHLVLTRQGKTVKAYINGVLKATKEHSSVKDFPEFRLGLANSSDVGLCRLYDFALGDTPIKALYNGGDPAGYVFPAAFRSTAPAEPFEPRTVEFNPGDPYNKPFCPPDFLRKNTIYEIDYTVDEWDYQPSTYASVGFSSSGGYMGGANAWHSLDEAKIGQVQRCCRKTADAPWIYLYGGQDKPEATARHLKVTVHSVRPVGCLAEYLPQNITPRAWLDSAPQQPPNAAHLPPLYASIGGYDLAVNGTPEIIYKK